MRPPDYMTCHETGHKELCKDLCNNCWKWVQIQGHNPNTGEPDTQWKCADAWVPLLMIENSQQQRKTGAAVESFRNESVKQSNILIEQREQVIKTIPTLGD